MQRAIYVLVPSLSYVPCHFCTHSLIFSKHPHTPAHSSAQYYVKVMQKVQDKGDEYIQTEQERLGRILSEMGYCMCVHGQYQLTTVFKFVGSFRLAFVLTVAHCAPAVVWSCARFLDCQAVTGKVYLFCTMQVVKSVPRRLMSSQRSAMFSGSLNSEGIASRELFALIHGSL